MKELHFLQLNNEQENSFFSREDNFFAEGFLFQNTKQFKLITQKTLVAMGVGSNVSRDTVIAVFHHSIRISSSVNSNAFSTLSDIMRTSNTFPEP